MKKMKLDLKKKEKINTVLVAILMWYAFVGFFLTNSLNFGIYLAGFFLISFTTISSSISMEKVALISCICSLLIQIGMWLTISYQHTYDLESSYKIYYIVTGISFSILLLYPCIGLFKLATNGQIKEIQNYVYCSSCGVRIKPDAKFCFACGNKPDLEKIENYY